MSLHHSSRRELLFGLFAGLLGWRWLPQPSAHPPRAMPGPVAGKLPEWYLSGTCYTYDAEGRLIKTQDHPASSHLWPPPSQPQQLVLSTYIYA